MTVGVNGGSAPPGVPHNQPFLWRDTESQAELLAMWHPGEDHLVVTNAFTKATPCQRVLLGCNLVSTVFVQVGVQN